MVWLASKLTGLNVQLKRFDEIIDNNKYNGHISSERAF